MGRKKRPAVTNNNVAIQQQQYPPMPPQPMAPAFDQYGRPIIPPPPPPMQMQPPPPPPQQQDTAGGPANKRSRTTAIDNNDNNNNVELEEGERHSYPVKKYRPDSYYRSIEAFQKYTKSHRMIDAAYVRWTAGGGTPEKPIVMGIKIAGTFLSWGRGKTRDAAIDASIRAAFALVAAHGYDDFTLTEDCFTEEPFDAPVSLLCFIMCMFACLYNIVCVMIFVHLR